MNKELKKTAVPRLRFPEFRKAEAWEEKGFENVAIFLKGKGISKSEVVPNGKLPCIRYGELYTKYGETIKEVVSFTNLDKSDLVLSQANDVIIPASGETKEDIATASCVIESGIALGGDLNIIRTKISGLFLSYYLNNVKKKEIAQLAQGISVVHLYPAQLQKLKINVPQPAEQTKLATFLTTLDTLISAESEKLRALQAHKKGLMQMLFPAAGETVPRVRFGEFEGEWEERKLGDKDVAVFVKEKTPLSKLKLETYISTENLLPDYAGVSVCSKLPPSGSFTSFKTGDILTSNIRPYLKKVWFATKDGAASNDVFVIRACDKISNQFLSFLLKNDDFINYVMKGAKGLKMPRGDKSLIEEYRIALPDKAEQQKIATTLTALDTLLAAQSEKLAALKQQKKGLMQQLFPSPNNEEI